MLICAGVSFAQVISLAHKNDPPVYFTIIAREAYKTATVESK